MHIQFVHKTVRLISLVGMFLAPQFVSANQSGFAAAHPTILSDLPPTMQARVSAVLGRDDAAYAIAGTPNGYRAENPANHLAAAFDASGVRVTEAGNDWGLTLQGYGYGDAPRAVAAAEPRAQANRVEYARGDMTEWYENGPLGLEQGFTLTSPPMGEGHTLTLALALALGGNLQARVNTSGNSVDLVQNDGTTALHYTGLSAHDATGRELPAWLNVQATQLLVHVNDDGAAYPVVIDPFIQQAKLTSSDGATLDQFGYSVAVSGDTAVVGAIGHAVGSNSQQGEAYVFVHNSWSGDLQENARLTASNGATGDSFGWSVAISGNTVVVGALDHKVGSNGTQGEAYVFVHNSWSGNLQENARLTASNGAAGDEFGYSVAISGNTVVVGVGNHHVAGKAYVFVHNTWSGDLQENARLTASNGTASDRFGQAVAISGKTVVVGAPNHTVGSNFAQGEAYVFVHNSWSGDLQENARLTASDGAPIDEFGFSVAISGNTVVVGAPFHAVGSNTHQGEAYVFVHNSWSGDLQENARLTASDGAGGDQFGFSVAVSGNAVVVGAPYHAADSNFAQGEAYAFASSNWSGNLQEDARLTASDGATGDSFGWFIAISGNTVVVGAVDKFISSNSDQGEAYVFGPPSYAFHLYLPLIMN